MTFFTAVATCFRKYGVFTGTASRAEYWWFTLFSVLVLMVLGAFPGPDDAAFDPARIGSIVLFLPGLAVAVRRLRDAGRSWLNLFWILVPVVGVILLIVFLASASRMPSWNDTSPAAR